VTLIQHTIGIPSQTNKTAERNKRDSKGKGIRQIINIFRCYDLIPERP
jgi:hypothetical protein